MQEAQPSTSRFGKYRLIAQIGRGGMADVHLALLQGPLHVKQLVVIKRLRSTFALDPEFSTMFLEEARLAAKLNDPHIIQTFEVGQVGGEHYLTMEYLEGVPLSRVFSTLGWSGPFTLPMGLHVLSCVLAGLHRAHELADFDGTPLRIVHRDVSPQNVFLTYDGSVKILDFGIAKAANSRVVTQIGTIKGKAKYMAPEQAQGLDVDRRADVYAAGVMLWEMLAGRRRWANASDGEVLVRLMNGEPCEPLRLAERGLPSELEDIATRALAHDRDGRFVSALHFQEALDAARARLGALPQPRDLGQVVAAAFAQEREARARLLKAVISGPPGAPIRLPKGDVAVANVAPDEESVESTLAARPTGAPVARPAASRRRTAVMVVSSVLFLGFGLALGLGVGSWERRPDAPPPTAGQVVLSIDVEPPEATLFLDAKPLGRGPTATVRLRADGREHVVRGEAEGHVATETHVRPGADHRVQLVLPRAPASP